jgi:hypothetical protein
VKNVTPTFLPIVPSLAWAQISIETSLSKLASFVRKNPMKIAVGSADGEGAGGRKDIAAVKELGEKSLLVCRYLLNRGRYRKGHSTRLPNPCREICSEVGCWCGLVNMVTACMHIPSLNHSPPSLESRHEMGVLTPRCALNTYPIN